MLDEFLASDGEKLIQDPLKRALFQRDLWAIFVWLADPHYHTQTGNLMAQRRGLRNRLAPIIRRLALSAAQIQALPDNYAIAVASKDFPPKHDPSRPDKPFLPRDLLDPNGPWVLLAEWSGLAAPQHVEFFGGRSAFFVLIKLPDGRQATLDYLKKLRTSFTQFPVGTHFALVRQMMLIDKNGNITPTRLIEKVQIRVFREIRVRGSQQDFYEFRLRRRDLFAGKTGGLHAVGQREEESAYTLFMGGLQILRDPFERPGRAPHSYGRGSILKSCTHCHGGRNVNIGPDIHFRPAIDSVLSFRGKPRPRLFQSNRRNQEQAVIRWNQRHYSWGLLEGLMENQPSKR